MYGFSVLCLIRHKTSLPNKNFYLASFNLYIYVVIFGIAIKRLLCDI